MIRRIKSSSLSARSSFLNLPIPSKQKRTFINRSRTVLGSIQDGGALVEFALIAPLMLGLIGGFFTFGFAFFTYFQLSNAVDIGARSLAVSRAMNSDGSTPDPCVTASAAIVAAAPALDPSKITLSLSLNSTPYSNLKQGSWTCTSGEANLVAGSTAQVTASYPYTMNFFGYRPVALTLRAQSAELTQ
ncbi:MAG: TadE/TadG family type IV pilus assembly protein [Terracidiphilus sp.]